MGIFVDLLLVNELPGNTLHPPPRDSSHSLRRYGYARLTKSSWQFKYSANCQRRGQGKEYEVGSMGVSFFIHPPRQVGVAYAVVARLSVDALIGIGMLLGIFMQADASGKCFE